MSKSKDKQIKHKRIFYNRARLQKVENINCESCSDSAALKGIYESDNPKRYDKQKYDYYPVIGERKKKYNNIENIDDNAVNIYNLLRENFDKVVYILEKTFAIKCTNRFWESCLMQFIKSRYYCAYDITERNLPYLFAYFGVCQKRLYFQKIKTGSDIYNALKNNSNLNLVPTGDGYVRLERGSDWNCPHFRFCFYKKNVIKSDVGTAIEESMYMYIDIENPDDLSIHSEIYKKRINLDQSIFMSLVTYPNLMPCRNKELLAIAKRNMPDIKPNSDSERLDYIYKLMRKKYV